MPNPMTGEEPKNRLLVWSKPRRLRRGGLGFFILLMRLMTPVGTSVLVVDQNDARADATRRLLIEQGYAVAGVLNVFTDLADLTAEQAADTIMIYANMVDEDLLDALRAIPAEFCRPMVLITEDGSTEAMHAAVSAGVNACVVVGVNGNLAPPTSLRHPDSST